MSWVLTYQTDGTLWSVSGAKDDRSVSFSKSMVYATKDEATAAGMHWIAEWERSLLLTPAVVETTVEPVPQEAIDDAIAALDEQQLQLSNGIMGQAWPGEGT